MRNITAKNKVVKKSKAGRKPISDKKVQVSLYIRQSKIDKFGGIECFLYAVSRSNGLLTNKLN